jgi:hypothetical protein
VGIITSFLSICQPEDRLIKNSSLNDLAAYAAKSFNEKQPLLALAVIQGRLTWFNASWAASAGESWRLSTLTVASESAGPKILVVSAGG